MDKFTPRQRHRIMASIKSKDTKPELLVRKYLWAQGFRYRLNYGRLPGHPDLVVVWECQLRPSLRQNTLQALAHTLNHILLTDYQQRYALPHPDEDEPMMAAEERRRYL